jgi:predicted aconitase with swiveling domain
VGELRAIAALLKGKRVDPAGPPLWVFTSSANKAIVTKIGLAHIITSSGALLLENTCPEVVPYDPSWVKQILTNSMKAEHYIKSGLNGIPTAVLPLADCIALAVGELSLLPDVDAPAGAPPEQKPKIRRSPGSPSSAPAPPSAAPFTAHGRGLPSQADFSINGEAFVTAVPITLLGFVNRVTGVIEEPGHPADGQSMAGKIAIFPKGSGSTVAPYVLLELFYRGNAPLAIVNTEIDQQSAPACSLEAIPYAFGFDKDIIGNIQSGDKVCLSREGETVTLTVIQSRHQIE